jgi:hypothetical protein
VTTKPQYPFSCLPSEEEVEGLNKRRRADNQKSIFLRALSPNLHISKIAESNYHASPRAATADPHSSSAVAGYDSEPEMISAASSPNLGGRAQVAFVVV